jgi:hypothetical protein
LINDYLLVSKGIWNKREQEIENIYQAMERVAKTKDLEINTSKEIKKFNSKYLNPYKLDKVEISEKETFRFSKYLNLDDYDKRSKTVNRKTRKTKGITLKKSKLKTSIGLLKGKTLDDKNIVNNEKEKTSKKKRKLKKRKVKKTKRKKRKKRIKMKN